MKLQYVSFCGNRKAPPRVAAGEKVRNPKNEYSPRVEIVSDGKVNIRIGNDVRYSRITQVPGGTTLVWVATAANGWHAVIVGSRIGWVSGKYSRLT